MKLTLFALWALLSLWQVQALAAEDSEVPTQESVISMADRYFGMATDAGGTAVVAVVKDGRILAMKGYGLDKPHSNKPVDPSVTMYRIGSVSKLFTAISTMQLIEKGVIDPNADVNTYLSKTGVKIHDRFSEPVTIRDLLHLRAGGFEWTYSYFYPLHDDDNLKIPPDEISRRLWRTAHPGDVAAYDNNGVGLVGEVASAAAGVSFRDLVRTNVLDPLGMKHSVVGLPKNRVPEMAGCEDTNIATAWRSCPYDLLAEHLRPSGDMTVTAEDMTKFMTMLLNKGELDGQRILTPESWKEFVDFSSNKLDPRLPTWGRIIYETFNGGRYAYGHDGGVGRFRTILRIYPQSGIAFFISQQTGLDWEHPFPIPSSLSDLLSAKPAKPPTGAALTFFKAEQQFEADFVKAYIPAAAVVAPAADLKPIPVAELAGRYWPQLAKGVRYVLLEMINRLAPTVNVEALAGNRISIALPGAAPKAFREVAVNQYQEEGGPRSIVFASSSRGINANFTDASTLAYIHQLPWHYRPWLTIFPLPIALVLLLTAVFLIPGAKPPAERRLGLLFAGGAVLTFIGLIAELQFVLDVLYHGGHTAIAVAWRLVLHCGVLALAIAPLYVLFARRELLSLPTGGTRVGKSAYVVLLCVSSWLVVLLAGYWGFLGRFTD
ncbi:MAG TPA: serine hydrolase domain-containing protein [Steroidobacteraceae bacterium]